MKLPEWQEIEGMQHYFGFMSLTLRIAQDGEHHVLQMLGFGGWKEIHKISNINKDVAIQRLKDYAHKIFRLERET